MERGHYGEWPEPYIANHGPQTGQTFDPCAEVVAEVDRTHARPVAIANARPVTVTARQWVRRFVTEASGWCWERGDEDTTIDAILARIGPPPSEYAEQLRVACEFARDEFAKAADRQSEGVMIRAIASAGPLPIEQIAAVRRNLLDDLANEIESSFHSTNEIAKRIREYDDPPPHDGERKASALFGMKPHD